MQASSLCTSSICAGITIALLGACGRVSVGPDSGNDIDVVPIYDALPATFTVSGTVTGFAGRDMVLQLNGTNDLAIDADGTFSFAAALEDGTAFTVDVLSSPICPERRCTLVNESGTLSGANVTNVVVFCVEPTYRLATHSWGDDSIRLTNDVQALADGSTATPRILTGNLTGLDEPTQDSIALDTPRDLIYAPTGSSVHVWDSASSVAGNVAPTRKISIPLVTELLAAELDVARDRIYVSGGAHFLYALDNASTLDGPVTPSATITLSYRIGTISLDRINDRLFVSGKTDNRVFVFDNASTLTSASSPDRTITWEGFWGPKTVAIDGCNDRLYLGSRVNIVAFDNASTLDGAVGLEADSQAQYRNDGCMSAAIDTQGRLYVWPDSAQAVRIFNSPETWSGDVTPTIEIDKTISGVVNKGSSIDVVSY
ncbi:MAG: hypothetical protein GY811_27325 [Myxococcales bacterium]|nr:hypothetical protein [Myxococcales bacterium]